MRLLYTKKLFYLWFHKRYVYSTITHFLRLIKQLIGFLSYSNFFYFIVHNEDYDILKLDGLELARSNLA